MKPVVVRNVEIGSGCPKICIPIVGKTQIDILAQAEAIRALPADLVEWRADFYDDVFEHPQVRETARLLRDTLGELPLLFTFRTAAEGGEKEIGVEAYAALCQAAAESGLVDLVDVELYTAGEAAVGIFDAVHRAGCKVVASNHDFHATPSLAVLIRRLLEMETKGADIAKIAVMPQSAHDVLTLLSATAEVTSREQSIPVISMSMGRAGLMSRLAGESFGSAVTFGAAGKASAPGQIAAEKLRQVLDIIHESV